MHDPNKLKEENNRNIENNLQSFTRNQNKFSPKRLQKIENITKKSQDIWVSKHQKMQSMETAKLKQCEPIFLEKGNSLKLLKRKNLNQIRISS